MSPESKHSMRSKSLCSLHDYPCKESFQSYSACYSRRSDSSVEISMPGCGSDIWIKDSYLRTISPSSVSLKNLEFKIDRLNDIFTEQCSLLSAIKDDIQETKSVMNCEFNEDLFEELSAKAIAVMQSRINELNDGEWSFDQQNSRATSLLNAIEYRPPVSLDREIRRALSEFLDNEELKERIVTATAEAVKEVISGCLSKDMSDIYLPTMERSHRRLSRHMARVLTDAFERYENSAMFMKHTHRASRALRRSLEQHELLLKTSNPAALHQVVHDTIGQFLKTELKEWRQKVLEMLTTEPEDEPEEQSPSMLPTTPQPADPEISLVDQLMRTAVINKFIEDGDVNGAFSNALSASDLSLVMTACRGADPATVFTQPCLLEQSVLLSLIQQLATDLVHETQLKCRYLEDALINLNLTDPNTMAHLPMVVGDVRKHLMKFLHAYPSHAASRRVALIVMAVDNLPK